MTEPEGDSQAISVAELLARNGQRVGAGGGGRRRRGVKGGISVAELTGEFPAVRNGREARDETSEAADSEIETPAAETPAAEARDVESEPAQPESGPAESDEAASSPTPDPDATAAFSIADAEAARKAEPEPAEEVADEKPQPEPDAKPVDDAKDSDAKDSGAKPVDDAPTLITPAVAPDAHKIDTGWRSVATTVLEPVQAQPLAHSGEPEPQLLSGQTVAGDLLRRDGDAAPEPDAGGADTALDDDSPAGPEDLPSEPSAAKQWAVLLGQGAVAVVAGALMFKGFEKLWDMLPMVALILAVLVIVGLVAMVRILRRTDDITSLVIAVVAGVFVTLGPLAFLLSTS